MKLLKIAKIYRKDKNYRHLCGTKTIYICTVQNKINYQKPFGLNLRFTGINGTNGSISNIHLPTKFLAFYGQSGSFANRANILLLQPLCYAVCMILMSTLKSPNSLPTFIFDLQNCKKVSPRGSIKILKLQIIHSTELDTYDFQSKENCFCIPGI